jgi:hypothetical protein
LGSLWKGKLLGFWLVEKCYVNIKAFRSYDQLTRPLKKMQASEFFPLLYYIVKQMSDAPNPCGEDILVYLFYWKTFDKTFLVFYLWFVSYQISIRIIAYLSSYLNPKYLNMSYIRFTSGCDAPYMLFICQSICTGSPLLLFNS